MLKSKHEKQTHLQTNHNGHNDHMEVFNQCAITFPLHEQSSLEYLMKGENSVSEPFCKPFMFGMSGIYIYINSTKLPSFGFFGKHNSLPSFFQVQPPHRPTNQFPRVDLDQRIIFQLWDHGTNKALLIR